MGFSYESEPAVREQVRVIERLVPQAESIIVKDGKLVFDRDNYPQVAVSRGFLCGPIHVGCHKLSKDAWKLLKKLVDSES